MEKKLITQDWQTSFPQLKYFSQGKFYKVLGPLVTGIELIKLPRVEEYRPHFVIYSLWGNKMGVDLKACLSGPNIIQEYYNDRGLQFSIPYKKHSIYFNDVLKSVKSQTKLPFDKDVSLTEIFSLIDTYSKRPPQGAAPNSYLQAKLYEFKLFCALYTGNYNQIQHVLNEIQVRDWDIGHFLLFNVNLKQWLDSLHKTILNRDVFLNQIEVNLKEEKINSLKKNKLLG